MKRNQNTKFAVIVLVCMFAAIIAVIFAGHGIASLDTTKPIDLTAGQHTDSDELDEHFVEQEIDYKSGTHDAELIFEGYEDQPITIEVYSYSAPITAERFCRLVDSGFYNGKPVYWILNEMYLRVGNTEQSDDHLISGEYEESEVKNSNALKRGVIAMNRAEDGQQSDASSFIIFMSDLSFLTSKYAGFAKIVENYEVIETIAQRTTAGDEAQRIKIDANGRIIDEAQYPRIKSITMID